MKDEKDEFYEKRMQMWKKREELLNSLSEKELRAFIKGYMMGERMAFRQLNSTEGCQSGSCQCSTCSGESCGCAGKDCGCGK
ncbi:MAG: hypothetical protein KGH61_02575 [Candidatus Micrarchaeota archaeon]|nr:hypothetical protein [Candidatus Micrarchaeota archaeon]MDE1847810.1 hypothetical protein [Candidatus Micrarchaeota archaeon]MDE1864384.1 hypothetical protein [Candidatus Micrarchaeota archaeon]